jgi:flagellar motor switch protein FliG
MKEYEIEIKETFTKVITVTASDEEYAEKIVKKMYYKDDVILLDYANLSSVEFINRTK